MASNATLITRCNTCRHTLILVRQRPDPHRSSARYRAPATPVKPLYRFLISLPAMISELRESIYGIETKGDDSEQGSKNEER
jgi:hypothetical protein